MSHRPHRRRALVGVAATALALALAAPVGADPAQDAAYADRAHQLLLGRDATSQESGAWVSALGAGTARSVLVKPVVQGELEPLLVEATYLGVLGRLPEASAATYWAGYLQRPTSTIRSFEALLLGSAEVRSLGGSPEGIVDLYYDAVLRRVPGASERAYWVAEVGSTSSGSVARRFLGSAEARTLDVRVAYESFLERPADASGLSFWVERLRATGDEQALWTHLVASAELYAASVPGEEAATSGADRTGAAGSVVARLALGGS